MAKIYLADTVGKRIKMLMTVDYPYELSATGWKTPGFCRSEKINFLSAPKRWGGRHIDCWGVSVVPLTSAKRGSGMYKALKYLHNQGIRIPRMAVFSRFYRSEYAEFLTMTIYLNPEYFGVS
jgi:hypothetical protein